MSSRLVLREETLAGDRLREFAVPFPTTLPTVRELIREHAVEESRYQQMNEVTQPVAEGDATERQVNNWLKRYDASVRAFEHGRMMVLVGDKPAETLDEKVALSPDTGAVVFVKMGVMA